MKTTIHEFYLMILIIIPFFVSGQNKNDISGTYVFGKSTELPSCDYDSKNVSKTTTDFTGGVRFEIIDEYQTGYVIKVYQLLIYTDKSKTTLTNQSTVFNDKYVRDKVNSKAKYFFLSYEKYRSANVFKLRNQSSFSIGAATSIIKIRPGIKGTFDDPYPAYFDFGNDFSLGILVGYKLYASRNPNKTFATNFLVGFGTTSIKVDSLRTKGAVNSTYNLSSFYFSYGIVWEYRNVQLGAFMGVDYLPGALGRNWVYRDRPWIGIALGYSIFNTKAPKTLNEQSQ